MNINLFFLILRKLKYFNLKKSEKFKELIKYKTINKFFNKILFKKLKLFEKKINKILKKNNLQKYKTYN